MARKNNGLVKIGTGELVLPKEIMPCLKESSSLGEADAEDRYTPYYCFNMRLKSPDDNWLPRDVFFHTLREDTKPQIEAVLLFLHKTNKYRVFDEKEGSQTLCQSLDRINGLWHETGEERKCQGCEFGPLPNGNWRASKPPACKLCYNFVGIDLEDREPFIITAKSTSATPAKRFLNRYFLRKFSGTNLPLFIYKIRLFLVQPGGTYSVLQFEVKGANSPSEIKAYAQACEELFQSQRVDFTVEQPEEAEESDQVPF